MNPQRFGITGPFRSQVQLKAPGVLGEGLRHPFSDTFLDEYDLP